MFYSITLRLLLEDVKLTEPVNQTAAVLYMFLFESQYKYLFQF